MPTAEPPRQPPNKYPRSALCTMPWVGAEMQERQNSVPPPEEFLGRQLKSWQPGMSVYTGACSPEKQPASYLGWDPRLGLARWGAGWGRLGWGASLLRQSLPSAHGTPGPGRCELVAGPEPRSCGRTCGARGTGK